MALWVVIEIETNNIIVTRAYRRKEKYVFVAEKFLSNIVSENMRSIRFLQQMAAPGIHLKHTGF